MKLRAYTAQDKDQIIALHAELQAYEQAFRKSRATDQDVSIRQVDEYEAMLSDDTEEAYLLVAEKDGRLIGYAFYLCEQELLEDHPGQVYVQDIMVTSSHRRSGVGAALIARIKNFMAERQIGRIDLQVLTGNEEALAFYKAQGFETAYLGLKYESPDDQPYSHPA